MSAGNGTLVPLEPGFPALPYVRLSTADQLKRGYTADPMVEACREKIAALDGTALPALVENAKGDDWDRDSFETIFAMADRGEIRMVVGFDTGRVARDLGLRAWFEHELMNRGVTLRYATTDFDDTPEGQLRDGFHGLIDKYEHAKIRMRTQMGLKQKRAKGEVIGNGPRPYGLDYTYNAVGKKCGYRLVEDEAQTLKWIVAQLRTEPLATICDWLNLGGVPTPSGQVGGWESTKILSLLKNRVYLGEYRFGEHRKVRVPREPGKQRRWQTVANDPETVTQATVPAILTYAELSAARAGMAERKRSRRGRRPDANDPFILRAALTCGYCGGVLSATFNHGYRRYTCLRAYPPKVTAATTRCPLPQVPAEAIEQLVWERFRAAALDYQEVADRLLEYGAESAASQRHASQVALLEERIAKQTRLIVQWSEDIETYEPDSVTYQRARERRPEAERTVKADRESLRALVEHPPAILSAEDIAGILARLEQYQIEAETADAAAKRRMLRQFRVGVTVTRAAEGEGERLGRGNRFTLAFDGTLDLSNGVNDPLGSLPLWDTQTAA